MKRLKFIFLLLSGVFVLSGCSGNEFLNDDMHDISTGSFTVSVSDGGYKENGGMQTRAIMDENPTFIAGDQIGLFAVENKNVLDDIQNLCLTAVDDGKEGIYWEVENGYGLMREDITYFAYFPYQADFNDQYSCYSAEEQASDFFFDLIDGFTINVDQGTYDKYKTCNLMVAKGSIINKKLLFTMEHQTSLQILDVPDGTRFMNCSPYPGSDGRYYYMFSYSAVVLGEHTNAAGVLVRWKAIIDNLAPGYYHLCTIDGGSATH